MKLWQVAAFAKEGGDFLCSGTFVSESARDAYAQGVEDATHGIATLYDLPETLSDMEAVEDPHEVDQALAEAARDAVLVGREAARRCKHACTVGPTHEEEL